MQRLGAYLLEGLVAMLASSGSCLYKALKCKEPASSDLLSYMHILYEVCPYFKFGYMSANWAIAEAMIGENSSVVCSRSFSPPTLQEIILKGRRKCSVHRIPQNRREICQKRTKPHLVHLFSKWHFPSSWRAFPERHEDVSFVRYQKTRRRQRVIRPRVDDNDQFNIGFYFTYVKAEKVIVMIKRSSDEQCAREALTGDSFIVTRDESDERLGRETKIIFSLQDEQVD